MSLAAVIALSNEQGEWVEDPLEVVVRNASHGGIGKNNKPKPSKCVLVDPKDPNVVLKCCWFGGNLAQYDDKMIRIAGRSNKVSTYNGNPELAIGKEGTVELIGPAPSMSGAPKQTHNGGGGGGNEPPPPADTGDSVGYFHKGMAKIALLLAHSIQYARNVEKVAGEKFSDDRMQSTVSSIFITAKDQGALLKPLPKLRPIDEKGLPLRYVADGPTPEEIKRREDEAAAKAAQAAEDARKASAAQNQLDEDVPF